MLCTLSRIMRRSISIDKAPSSSTTSTVPAATAAKINCSGLEAIAVSGPPKKCAAHNPKAPHTTASRSQSVRRFARPRSA
jgi:hypothetical protein